MTLTAEEFLRRFMLHVLPRGFVRIRFSGFLANRRRKQLRPLCQRLLNCTPKESPQAEESSETKPTWLCPHCGGPIMVVEKLTAQQVSRRSACRRALVYTS